MKLFNLHNTLNLHSPPLRLVYRKDQGETHSFLSSSRKPYSTGCAWRSLTAVHSTGRTGHRYATPSFPPSFLPFLVLAWFGIKRLGVKKRERREAAS